MKICYRCLDEHDASGFTRNNTEIDGLNIYCRACVNAKSKAWKAANREHVRTYQKNWYAANRKHAINCTKEWRKKHPTHGKDWYALNRERKTAYNKEWRISRREHIREWRKERYRNDIIFRLKNIIRQHARRVFRGKRRFSKSIELVGCTREHLMFHLEFQFKDGMSWSNYGDWEIDHVRPLASFDLMNHEQRLLAMHWTNLQPLWASENRKKSAIWNEDDGLDF